MKRNHSLLEYTRDNDTQVSKLGPFGPSCFRVKLMRKILLDGFSCILVIQKFFWRRTQVPTLQGYACR